MNIEKEAKVMEITTSKVPAPWTPVELEVSADQVTARVWGRVYSWEHSLLPASIQTAGRELLAAPAQLHALFGEKEAPISRISYTRVCAQADRAVFAVGAAAGNVMLNIRYTIEYDGFLEMAMSVIPYWSYSENPLDAAPSLDGLYFEFPIHTESSTLYHFWPNGESGIAADPSVMGSGALPQAGLQLPFKPYVWAGWEFGGLGIATESDENIQLSPGVPCITIENARGCRVLRWNLLNKAPRQWFGRVDRWISALPPLEYKFALQATPVKELRKDRMDIRIQFAGLDMQGKCLEPDENGECLLDRYQKAGINWVQFHEEWSAVQNYGLAANEELLRTYVRECHRRGIKIMVYFGYELSTNAPMWQEKREEYVIKTPQGAFAGGWQRENPCQRDYMVCYASEYSKIMCERIRFVLHEYDVDGIYTDGTHIPWECANAEHGCGYTDAHGARHATYPIWAVRRHAQAMYEAIHSKDGAINHTHQSSCMVAGTIGYGDYFFNGESIQDSLQKGFLEFLDLPAIRTEFMGHNIGIPAQMLAYQTERMRIEKYNSLCVIHDILPAGEPDDVEYLSKFWNEFSAFGTGSAKWYPYWIEGSPVRVQTPNVFCSLYERDGMLLAAVSSFNEAADEVKLTFDRSVEVMYDVLEQGAASAEGCTVTIRMEAYKPNLICLKKTEG